MHRTLFAALFFFSSAVGAQQPLTPAEQPLTPDEQAFARLPRDLQSLLGDLPPRVGAAKAGLRAPEPDRDR